MAENLTILLKVSLSKANVVTFSIALIVAALGALYNKASSPNDSPGMYVFSNFSSYNPANLL